MKPKDRLKEPSTWAGIGLAIQGLMQAFATGGIDPEAWATIGAGVVAIMAPERGAEGGERRRGDRRKAVKSVS